MSEHDATQAFSRRSFLQTVSIAGLGTLLVDPEAVAGQQGGGPLPRRVLGRTGQELTLLGLGTWPCGKTSDLDVAGVARLVQEALDLGINFIDSARAYDKAEEAIGRALQGRRRNQIFLTTKVWADTAEEARRSFEQSLRLLKTDHVDLLYLHQVGNRDLAKATGKSGAIEYMLQQKKKGTARFLGLSGHSHPGRFVPLIETGHFDVVMSAMNFVDRFTYGFEHKVLPAARRQKMGVVGMKVLGGMQGGFATASGPKRDPMVPKALLQQAIRYTLGLPGVASIVIGPHTVEQLRENVKLVAGYKPLSPEEMESLVAVGKKLAGRWGPHFGPVA